MATTPPNEELPRHAARTAPNLATFITTDLSGKEWHILYSIFENSNEFFKMVSAWEIVTAASC